MEYLIMGLQLILSLSILVTLHEMGHFFPARWFGMRVEKFYLFFNPWFSVWKVQRGETEYGLGWLPLGGYVKIAGMVDESMDTEQLAQAPEPWEFRSKPAWQRLIVMLGGVFVNFILGFFLWGMLLWVYGKEYIPAKNAVHGLSMAPLALEMGLKDGDKILSVGNITYDQVSTRPIVRGMLIDGVRTLTIERDGQTMTLQVADTTVSKFARFKGELVSPRVPFVIAEAVAGMPAEKAGIQKGDSLIALNGDTLPFYNEFSTELKKLKDTEVAITLVRGGTTQEIKVKTNDKGLIGVAPKLPATATESFGFFQALPMGVTEGLGFLGDQLKAFGRMFSGEIKASESLGGFGSIANLFPRQWDWQRFWYITAVLSLILGFMNLLPIPALDGGHAIFLIIEIIIRRPVNQKVLEYAQRIGFLLLIALLLYANGLDIYRAITGK